jgi:hypothetical protein
MNSIDQNSKLQPIDRRQRRRGKTFKVGKLIFGGANPTVVDCFVIELSATGARVETQVMIQVPDIMTLRLVDMSEYRVRRAWAIGNRIGLEFLTG